jgi:hypothetical protein
MSERREQLSVPLPSELLAYIKERAREEERSLAAIVRRLVAEAAKQHQRNGGKRAA